MKFVAAAISLTLWSGAWANRPRRRKQGRPCNLGVRVLDSIYEDQGPTYDCFCELQGSDRNPNRKGLNRVKIRGNGLEVCSGDLLNLAAASEYEMYADDGEIDDDESVLDVAEGSRTEFKKRGNGNNSSGRKNRNLQAIGSKEVLVIRVGGPDSGYEPPFTQRQLRNDFFNDAASLRTQTEQCSANQMNIIRPHDPGNNIRNGVLEVKFSDNIAGIAVRTLEANVYAELANRGIDITNVVLAMCFPTLTFTQATDGYQNFAAYAVPNGFLMVFRGSHCGLVSTQMHEMGHIYGLKHSGDLIPPYDADNPSEGTFGDRTGFSGGWASPDNVEMCYNGAKTWQLGWRPTLDIDPIGDGTGLTLTSFNDWDENASDEVCIVRIVAQSKLFFVHYNRAVGMNAGVQEYANLVLVSQRSSSEEYVDGDSQLLAALGSGGSFNQPDAGGTGHEMVVTVNSINGATANVDVTFPTLTPQTPSPVMVPQTPAPVVALTPAPVVPPTPSPVEPLTPAPVLPTQNCQEASVAIPPEFDVEIRETLDRGGTRGTIVVDKVTGDGEARALIKFDLTGLPNDAVATSAELRFYTRNPTSGEIAGYQLSTSWDNDSGWSALPNGGVDVTNPPPESFSFIPSIDEADVFVTVTTAEIQGWLDDPPSNNGWVMVSNSNNNWVFRSVNAGNGNASQRPYLTVNYSTCV